MKMTPKYFPIENGLYSLAPGLKPLGTDFGNQDFDKKVFQLTPNFPFYRESKLRCRQERLTKYFCEKNLSSERLSVFSRFIIEQLLMEYPEVFSFDGRTLFCSHTKDQIKIDQDFHLVHFSSLESFLNPPVLHVIDALALQVEEDLAFVCNNVEAEENFVGLLHLCSASHWAAEDKIGRNFFDIHAPIPGIEKVNRVAQKLVETMIDKGPFVRFIWSFVTDQRLNHHPVAPPGEDEKKWKGRSFDKNLVVPFYLRVERQVTWGFPAVGAALFTISVSFLSGQDVKNDPYQRSQLLGALRSMTPESLEYKGVTDSFKDLVEWLEGSSVESMK